MARTRDQFGRFTKNVLPKRDEKGRFTSAPLVMPKRDNKGRFIKNIVIEENYVPKRDSKGRFIKR